MSDAEMDQAVEIATEKARQAERRFVETPVGSPDLTAEAQTVERRAEDLYVLTEDATDATVENGRQSG